MNSIATYVNRYKHAKIKLYKQRNELAYWEKTILAFFIACLTALGAQMRIYLPFTPVPITLQVFFVLLSGVILGKGYSGLSQGIYLGMGLIGLPVFAGWNGGYSILLGVTGGYLFGFILASTIIGWAIDTKEWRSIPSLTALMLLGVSIIYGIGIIQLSIVLNIGLLESIILGGLPFILGDIVKVIAVVFLGGLILPNKLHQ